LIHHGLGIALIHHGLGIACPLKWLVACSAWLPLFVYHSHCSGGWRCTRFVFRAGCTTMRRENGDGKARIGRRTGSARLRLQSTMNDTVSADVLCLVASPCRPCSSVFSRVAVLLPLCFLYLLSLLTGKRLETSLTPVSWVES
jgi:hypothetical protein